MFRIFEDILECRVVLVFLGSFGAIQVYVTSLLVVQSVICEPATMASPESLIVRQGLKPHLRSTESTS